MRIAKFVPFALAALVALVLPLTGQSTKGAPKQAKGSQAKQTTNGDETVISLDVVRVPLLYTVSDKKGRFVSDLKREDFELTEAKKPQSIIEFSAESDLPLRLAVVIDTSNSIRERFKFQQEAATDFVNTMIRAKTDKAAIISFDTTAELVADLTDDTGVLGAAIRSLRPGGGTALYDAIFFACKDKLSVDRPSYKYRRALVLLSDGEDNQSRWTREQALEMAHKSDVVIYTISTNITRIDTDGDKVLRYLAQETGGLAFFPFKSQDLAQSFENIANELRHQYSLLYRPEPLKLDGLYHAVDLRVKGRKDLTVRVRRGYYAGSEE